MRRPLRSLGRFLAIPTVLALTLGGVQLTAPATAAPAAAMITMAPGHVLQTAKGLTLYAFSPDKPGVSTCYKTCAKYWPPYLVAKGTMPVAKMAGVPGTFGVAMRTDGTQQLTYDKAPLYTFLEDKDSGDFYGQGVYASGGYWWAVIAAGK